MLRHVLVPLDGSRLAAVAVPYAATLARALDARLSLLGDVEPLPEFTRLPSATARESDERQISVGTAYLESVAAPLRARGRAVTTVIRHGNPGAEITAYAEEAGCDLIVMGTHGRTGIERVRMGSVAQHVVRNAIVPTLVVPPSKAEASAGEAAITGVTVTLDGSALAEGALPLATRIATALSAPLTLLRVIPSLTYLATAGWEAGYSAYYPMTEGMEREEEQAIEGYLAGVATGLRAPGLEVRTRWLRSVTNRAEDVIAAFLAERPTGIAIMASHGRGGVLRWALGSTTEGVLDQAPCPILIVRAGVIGDTDPLSTGAAPHAAGDAPG